VNLNVVGEYEIKGHKQEGKPYGSPFSIIGNIDAYLCPMNLCFNPYVGCSFNCIYCYARMIEQIGGNWKRLAPCSIETVKDQFENAFVKNSNDMISSFMRRKHAMRTSNLTDPFQPVELKHRVMERSMDYFIEYQYPMIINTKSHLVALPQYIDKMKQFPCGVQITLISDSNEVLSKLEPGAPSFDERLETLKKLSDAGIYTMIRYSPVILGINDKAEGLFEKVAKAGCKCVVTELLYLKGGEDKYLSRLFNINYKKFLMGNYPTQYKKEYNRLSVEDNYKIERYNNYKKLAKDCGMELLVCCEEMPEINDWKNCCGSHLCGAGEGCEMTVMMAGNKIGATEVSYDQYAENFKNIYPLSYLKRFEEEWNTGRLQKSLLGCRFNAETKTYIRDYKKEEEKQVGCYELFGSL
jgi:DNA repair photolyase